LFSTKQGGFKPKAQLFNETVKSHVFIFYFSNNNLNKPEWVSCGAASRDRNILIPVIHPTTLGWLIKSSPFPNFFKFKINK